MIEHSNLNFTANRIVNTKVLDQLSIPDSTYPDTEKAKGAKNKWMFIFLGLTSKSNPVRLCRQQYPARLTRMSSFGIFCIQTFKYPERFEFVVLMT